MKNQHLISVDELRAAGALDVPPAWRKSLFVERDLFSLIKYDEESLSDDQGDSPPDEEDDEEADAVDDLP